MKITRSKNCGNSPKNGFVENFSISLIKSDLESLAHWVTDDVEWKIGDESEIIGKANFLEEVQKRRLSNLLSITIMHVVSHGKVGAANGSILLKPPIESQFCHVFEFSSAAARSIKRIQSYGTAFCGT